MGPVPLGPLCSLQGNLALFLRANGQRLEAEALLAKVLDGRRKIFGVKHPDTIISMNNCAAIAMDARHKCGAALNVPSTPTYIQTYLCIYIYI